MSRVPRSPESPKQRNEHGRCSPTSPTSAPCSPEQHNSEYASPMLPSVVHWPFSMPPTGMQPTSTVPNLILPAPTLSTQVAHTSLASTSMVLPTMVQPLAEQLIGPPPQVHSSLPLFLPTPPPTPAPISPDGWSELLNLMTIQDTWYRTNAAILASHSLTHHQHQHQMQLAAMRHESVRFDEQSPSPQEEQSPSSQEEPMDLSLNHSPMTCMRQASEQERGPLRLREENDPQPSTSRCTDDGKHTSIDYSLLIIII